MIRCPMFHGKRLLAPSLADCLAGFEEGGFVGGSEW